jgi:hypothetical protein
VRAAPALLALLLLAGCLGRDSPTPSTTGGPTAATMANLSTAPAVTGTTSQAGPPSTSEEARLPMLLVEHTFQPAEGKLHAYDQVEHCPSVGRHAPDGQWSIRLSPGNATPSAGLLERWDFTSVHWVSTVGSARGMPFWGAREGPLRATFGEGQLGVLAFDGAAFRLDGQPLQDGAQRTLAYSAVDDDGKAVALTETLAFHLFPDAPVTVERPSGFICY